MNNLDQFQKQSAKVTRELFTPLGKIYYKEAEQWQRSKIESEALKECGITRHKIRSYMVSTPAAKMNSALMEIILRTLPWAEKCFSDPELAKRKAAFSLVPCDR